MLPGEIFYLIPFEVLVSNEFLWSIGETVTSRLVERGWGGFLQAWI